MRRRSEVLDTAVDVATVAIKFAWEKATPSRLRRQSHECIYCCEIKRQDSFIASVEIPYTCQHHFVDPKHVCRTCMEVSLRTQFDCKPLIEVGCPECGRSWEPFEVQELLALRDLGKFKQMERLAKERTLIPADMPDGATIDVLLAKGARFW